MSHSAYDNAQQSASKKMRNATENTRFCSTGASQPPVQPVGGLGGPGAKFCSELPCDAPSLTGTVSDGVGRPGWEAAAGWPVER